MPKPTPKVLFYYLDFGSRGGIRSYIHQVCLALQAGGRFEPVVVCSLDTPFFHHLKEDGIEVHGVPMPRWIPPALFRFYTKPLVRLVDLSNYWHIARLLQQIQPDLVHVHMGRLENRWFKALGYPLIYTFHGYFTPFSIRDTRNAVERWFVRQSRPLFAKLAPHLDALLFVSHAERDRMLEEGFLAPEHSGEVLHNGLPIQQLRQQAEQADGQALRQSLGLPPGARCVSFINRIDKFKDPLRFVALAERLGQMPALQPIHFLIAGTGHQLEEVRQRAAQSPIAEQIHVLGHRNDVQDLFALSDLAVYLPVMEGFGLSVLEAMASGTPCLAHATGGIVELLDFPEGQRCLVDPQDFEALVARAVELLTLDDAARRELAHHLQERALVFDMAPFIQRLEAVYHRVLGTPLETPPVDTSPEAGPETGMETQVTVCP